MGSQQLVTYQLSCKFLKGLKRFCKDVLSLFSARQMTPGNGDQNQTCISASKPIQTGSRHDPTLGMTEIIERNRSQISDELMEDEEISVTDSEDEKVIQNRGGYDDSGCHEEDFQVQANPLLYSTFHSQISTYQS